jgi:hypothetical protein
MNQSRQVERTAEAVGAYANAIDVPCYDEAAIRRRMSHAPANDRHSPRATLRFPAAVAAACALVAIFVLGSPTVVAQVERILHAFAVIGGQTVPVAVNSVTLDQARRDMRFAVIAPAAIPPGFSEQIDELSPSTSRLDSKLLFRFSGPNGGPSLTIMEGGSQKVAPDRMRLWMTSGTNALPPNPPALPKPETGQHMFVQFGRNGQVQQRVEIHPITWIERGTRIDIISPPGLLSPMQLAAIRRAMSL